MWLDNNKNYLIVVLIILVLAVALRVGYVSRLDGTVHWVDEEDYLSLAKSLVNDMHYSLENGKATAFRPPGYPLFLAGLYMLGVQSVSHIRLAQVLLSVLTLVLMLLIANRLGGRGAAIISILIGAFYPYFIFICGTIFATTWFSFLLVSSVYFLIAGIQDKSLLKIIVSGVLMGGVVLTRTSALVLGVAALLWMVLNLRSKPGRAVVHAAVFSLSLAFIITPWVIRNSVVLGKATLSTNGGRNLWLGNNPSSTINSGSNIEMPSTLEEKIESASETMADYLYVQEALGHIRSNPGHYMWLAVKKGLYLWRFDPSRTTEGYSWLNSLYPALSILSYTPMLLFAVLAFFRANKAQKNIMWLWLGFAIVYTLMHAVFISKVRFRIPLDHFIAIMASLPLFQWIVRSTLYQRLMTRC